MIGVPKVGLTSVWKFGVRITKISPSFDIFLQLKLPDISSEVDDHVEMVDSSPSQLLHVLACLVQTTS